MRNLLKIKKLTKTNYILDNILWESQEENILKEITVNCISYISTIISKKEVVYSLILI